MTGIILRPLSKPMVVDIAPVADGDRTPSIFTAIQKLVEGYVEIVNLPIGRDGKWVLAAYINEDGISQGMPLNREICGYQLLGPIVVMREHVDGDGETQYMDVTAKDVALVDSVSKMFIPLPRSY